MKKLTISLLMIIFGSLMISSCNDNTNSPKDISTQINDFPKENLSTEEMQSLIFMREEEKLAYDVYITLYNKWKINIFDNIAKSEKTHTEAVLTLINKYNLVDPVGNSAVGVYQDTTLQKLYTSLVEKGSLSSLDAFIIGATIEDLDIHDLNKLSLNIDNQDIKFVFGNLNKGSRNHLRSFYSQIISNGGMYKAQFITQAELEAIINSPNETGSW